MCHAALLRTQDASEGTPVKSAVTTRPAVRSGAGWRYRKLQHHAVPVVMGRTCGRGEAACRHPADAMRTGGRNCREAGWQLTITSSRRSTTPAFGPSPSSASWSRPQHAATSSALSARRSWLIARETSGDAEDGAGPGAVAGAVSRHRALSSATAGGADASAAGAGRVSGAALASAGFSRQGRFASAFRRAASVVGVRARARTHPVDACMPRGRTQCSHTRLQRRARRALRRRQRARALRKGLLAVALYARPLLVREHHPSAAPDLFPGTGFWRAFSKRT